VAYGARNRILDFKLLYDRHNHITACTLAKSHKVTLYTRGFRHFVTSMTAPIASVWNKVTGRRVRWGGSRRVWGMPVSGTPERVSLIEEGHLMPDHVHIMISIPPKYAVSQVVGFIKGKSAIHIARMYAGRKQNYVGQHFWARGYFASTVGRDEQVIRNYIRHQEDEDRRVDQMKLM
jgi:putative transposase